MSKGGVRDVTMRRRSSCNGSTCGNAMANCYVMSFLLCVALISLLCLYLGIFSRLSFEPSMISTSSPLMATYQEENKQRMEQVIHWDPQNSTFHVESKISCDKSHYHYDQCSINGPTVLDPTKSTFYAIGPKRPTHFMQKIRPYPRKWENHTISTIKEVTLLSGPKGPQCDMVHNTSALVYSVGGYTGNFFHDINEGFLPLFLTVRSMSLTNQDVTLVIERPRDWWVSKYSDLLGAFSKYPIINLDNETITHCFRSVTLGLVSHGFMTVDPKSLPKPITLLDFHFFLDKALGKAHKPDSLYQMDRPKLVMLQRAYGVGRALLNEVELKTIAENMGFDVTMYEPKSESPLSEAYGLMNASHVMIGVHGAALTHLLFLRPRSIFIQVVPLGVDWVAELCYGKPAKEMDLDYVEYKIELEESTLIEKYNKSDPVIQDPKSVHKKGWDALQKVYLKEQNVRINLIRFRKYLKYAYKKAKRSISKVG